MAHTPFVEDALEADCYYGECIHEGDCPPVPTVACDECSTESVEGEADGMIWLTKWPCIHAKRRGDEDEIVQRLLAAHASEEPTK